MNSHDPKINIEPTVLYIEADPDPNAYDISEMLKIEAIDWRGVGLNKEDIVLDTSMLNSTLPGSYNVSIAAIDKDYNASRKDLTVIVVPPDEVEEETEKGQSKLAFVGTGLSASVIVLIILFITYTLWDMFR